MVIRPRPARPPIVDLTQSDESEDVAGDSEDVAEDSLQSIEEQLQQNEQHLQQVNSQLEQAQSEVKQADYEIQIAQLKQMHLRQSATIREYRRTNKKLEDDMAQLQLQLVTETNASRTMFATLQFILNENGNRKMTAPEICPMCLRGDSTPGQQESPPVPLLQMSCGHHVCENCAARRVADQYDTVNGGFEAQPTCAYCTNPFQPEGAAACTYVRYSEM